LVEEVRFTAYASSSYSSLRELLWRNLFWTVTDLIKASLLLAALASSDPSGSSALITCKQTSTYDADLFPYSFSSGLKPSCTSAAPLLHSSRLPILLFRLLNSLSPG